MVSDKFGKTSAKILSGTYSNNVKDYNGRILTQTVNTGWIARTSGTLSNIFVLWGMTSTLGSTQSDIYTLSMNYEPNSVKIKQAKKGFIGIATTDANGKWVKAVSKNIGGNPKFVSGPWQPNYGLGTYGIDTSTKTVWAVINYNGNFVVAPGI